jgi:hypothetical protein
MSRHSLALSSHPISAERDHCPESAGGCRRRQAEVGRCACLCRARPDFAPEHQHDVVEPALAVGPGPRQTRFFRLHAGPGLPQPTHRPSAYFRALRKHLLRLSRSPETAFDEVRPTSRTSESAKPCENDAISARISIVARLLGIHGLHPGVPLFARVAFVDHIARPGGLP